MPGFNPFPSLLFRFEAVNLFPGKEPEVPRELNRQTMINPSIQKGIAGGPNIHWDKFNNFL
jgi:hypothetical protein